MSEPQDIWCLWPDGYMCPRDEIEEYGHRSDDYELIDVKSYENAEPTSWVRL